MDGQALAALPRLAEPVILLALGHQLGKSGLFKPRDGEVRKRRSTELDIRPARVVFTRL
jgi:hypothetical protein